MKLMGVQVYCGARMPLYVPPGEVEEDDVMDFEDIGGVYNDPGQAAANTAALNSFLASRITSTGVYLTFSGPRIQAYNDKRQPGTAWLDVSSGPITYAPSGATDGSLTFVGLPGSVIRGSGTPPAATTPIFQVTRPNGGVQTFLFQDLEFQHGLGSGFHFIKPGKTTKWVGCRFRQIGTSIVTPPTIQYDDWTDLDTAVYGLKLEDADGGHLLEVDIQNVAGHGLIAKRWHEASALLHVRECEGSGAKIEQAQGTTLNLRSESNWGWGLHARDVGNEVRDTATPSPTRSEAGTATAWEMWCEANNGRGATNPATLSTGHRYRQTKFDSSARLTVGGQSGWSSGKVAIEEPTRRSMRIVEQDWIDPSPGDGFCTLLYDLNADGAQLADGTQDNWTTVWPSAGDRPTTTAVGDTVSGTYEIQIDVPQGAFNDAAVVGTQAIWTPIPSSVTIPDTAVGDKWMWTAEVSTDAAGAAYCNDREALAYPAPRMQSFLGSFAFNTGDGSKTFALWNTAKQKFSGRIHVEIVRSLTLQISNWFTGMEDVGGSGLDYPESQIRINLHSLKLYRVIE